MSTATQEKIEFEAAYTLYHDRTYYYALNALENPADAEDLNSVVWEHVWRGWAKFDGRFVLAWIIRIFKNELYDFRRITYARYRILLPIDSGDLGAVDDGLGLMEELEDVGMAYNALGEYERSVIEARVIAGSNAQAAAMMGTNANAFGARLCRARAQLRALMEQQK